jgi:hypothetical protein
MNSKRFLTLSSNLDRESKLSLQLTDMIFSELKHPTIYISGIEYYLIKAGYCTSADIKEYIRSKCAALARKDMEEYNSIASAISIFLLLVAVSEGETL